MARVKYVLVDGVRMVLDNGEALPIVKPSEEGLLEISMKKLEEKEAQDNPVVEIPASVDVAQAPEKKVAKKKASKKVSKKASKKSKAPVLAPEVDEEL